MYLITVYTTLLINMLLETKTLLTSIPAFVLSHLMDFNFTSLIMYLSVGTCIQYALVRLKKVNLFDNIREGIVLNCMRIAIGTLAGIVVGVRCTFGAYSIAYPRLMNKDFDIRPNITMSFMVPLITYSIAINIVFRLLIRIEKRKNKEVYGIATDGESSNLPTGKYIALAVLLGVAVVAVLVIDIKMQPLYSFFRDVQIGLLAIIAPFVAIRRNRKMYASAKKKVISIFPCHAYFSTWSPRVGPA